MIGLVRLIFLCHNDYGSRGGAVVACRAHNPKVVGSIPTPATKSFRENWIFMTNSAMVLLSGGQDSATCLAWALERYDSVQAICFDYGQRHRVELECAKDLAREASIPLKIMPLDIFSSLTQNALTSSTLTIESSSDGLPNTFVPGRNLIFLTTAAIAAYQQGCRTLVTGVCQTDYSGYPDCRDDFVQSAQSSISLALDDAFTIETPLMYLTKSQTVKLMQSLNKLHWYGMTHTCYEGLRPACGRCPSCLLRLKGFQDAGIPDPLDYDS